jgi:hypothetical protein
VRVELQIKIGPHLLGGGLVEILAQVTCSACVVFPADEVVVVTRCP